MQVGFVYLIFNDAKAEVKIGFTTSPQRRLKTLQTANSDRLVMLHCVDGDKSLEAWLHRKFAMYHLSGEWFEDCPEIREWFERESRVYTEQTIEVWTIPPWKKWFVGLVGSVSVLSAIVTFIRG